MTYDLYRNVWNDPYIQQFGAVGQGQDGVDICGHPNGGKAFEGIQCKCVDKLSPKRDIEHEYRKSQAFQPKLSRFVIVTTSKRDTRAQRKAFEITNSEGYPCEIVFWEDVCQRLSEHPEILRKYYSDFIIFETAYDCPGKLVKIDIDVSHFEILISRIDPRDDHYKGTVLVADLLSGKCITYRIGDHWSRIVGVVGMTKCDAFLVSKWLNSFDDIESLLCIGKTKMFYHPSEQDKEEAKDNGFVLMNC
jgi:hypothetical protein